MTGQRCLVVYQSGIESVFKGLSEIFKAGIEVLLLESSRAAGRNIVDSAAKGAKTDVKRVAIALTKRFA